MRIVSVLIFICTFVFPAALSAQRLTAYSTQDTTPRSPQSLAAYVDPYIGSGGHGHVFVGASVPFGAVQLGPENFYKGWDWCSGYNYGDSVLIGFAHTHLSGTGIGDLADILVMPYTGTIKTDKGLERVPGSGYASHYTHRNETVRPGYYSVRLDDYHIDVELTATERVGFHRYHFPPGKQAHVIVDLKEGINDQATDTYIEQVDDSTFKGFRFSKGWAKNQMQFFAIRTSAPIHGFSVYDGDTLLEGKKGEGRAIKGLISFNHAPATLLLKVGLSPVSGENALDNIAAEIPGWNFEDIAKQADEKWNRELSKITVETPDEKEKRIFYTSVYHTMIDPCLFNDDNGDYRGTDKRVYKQAPFANYTVFSTWDTYRAAHPLYIITQPDRVGDMVNSMLAVYDQQGRLPIWQLVGNDTHTMVGISSMQIIAEAYIKGIAGFDSRRAFDAIKATAMGDSLGLMYVKNFKAIPSDKESRSVAKGLEYAIGDGSTALMARQMGRDSDYAYFRKRSENYHLYFDSLTGFFRAKLSDGSWTPNFDPFRAGNVTYAEGNAWQYLWPVPQDVPGLISLLGGRAVFNARLDSFFALPTPAGTQGLDDLTGTIGQYAHGNEPSHHVAYLYAYSGEQWKTAEKVRYIIKEMYKDDPDGVIGNEDCGQMSAWNVFSSLGFYPVFPASGEYIFGSPAVDKAVIHLASGATFTVIAENNSPENIYIQRIELNGREYNKNYLLHSDLMKGGVLKFFMGDKPNKAFGDSTAATPLQGWEKPFTAFAFRTLEKDGHVLPYRLYSPPAMTPGKKYPLVIFFHGAGEKGLDNRSQFFRFAPFPFWEKYPCYVIAPECPPKLSPGGPDGESTWVQTAFGAPGSVMKPQPTWPMRLAMEAIAKTIKENNIDPDRVYVTGLSMGGFATWEILQREPDLFAAAMPVCGGADTTYARALKAIPLWVFHGSADSTVMPRRSRDMVAALERAGGHPKYTEFPGVGHGAWAKTYPDSTVWDWLFAQRRTRDADLFTMTGDLRLPPLVGDNMVLQRDCKLPVWGWAKAGKKVEVSFRDKHYRATADKDGKWILSMDPCAAGGPYEMTIRAGKDVLHIKNILVGEVWLCSGQSNMVLDFNNVRVKALYTDDIAASANDNIRQLLVGRAYGYQPAEGFKTSGWKSAGPRNLPAFSAAAYFFALTLYQKYHVPIGIINSSNGGTMAEAWTSEAGLKEFPQFARNIVRNATDPKNEPSVLFDAMIAPLIPYAIRGVAWYQGEYNTHRAYEYRRLFPALIRDWRNQWKKPTLPFLFQQLPNFQTPVAQPSENEWAELRDAQLLTWKTVPNTAMAVAIDIGGNNELHPADKKDIGTRLALQAEKLAYGETLVSSGPLYRDMRVEGNKIILSFDYTGGGLVAKGSDSLAYFAIAGADHKFVWATAMIRGNTVEVYSSQVEHPVSVRYAWAGDPRGCNLYNREGLPASPFRTDDWPGLTINNE